MRLDYFAAFLCSGLLATQALKITPPEGSDSEDHSPLALSNGQQRLQSPLQIGPETGGDDDLRAHRRPLISSAEDKTIYQTLNENEKFSRLVKVINISDEVVSLLNDPSTSITFFAPPNRALRPPRRHKRHINPISTLMMDDSAATPEKFSSLKLADLIDAIDQVEAEDDDEDKERRKKFIRILVRAVLSYHIIPQSIDATQLVQNTTYPTNLTIPDSALDKESLRIRVSTKLLPPSVRINFFSTVIKPDVKAKNGVIHVINHPLLPPPSIFQELFLVSRAFGTLTSALQRVGLTDALEWRYVPTSDDDQKKWTVQGTGSTTFFAPSDNAFKKLPFKLQLFLFSPFGERVLKKLLEYHIVPGLVLHSDYAHNTTSGETLQVQKWSEGSNALAVDYDEEDLLERERAERKIFGPRHHKKTDHRPPHVHDHEHEHDHRHSPRPPCTDATPKGPCGPRGRPRRGSHPPKHRSPLPHPVPIFSANFTTPTLLANHSLHIHTVKLKYSLPIPKKEIYVSKLFVNHQIVEVADVISRNGAVHVISRVLSPRYRHKYGSAELGQAHMNVHDEWEDWEDWLLQWAAEN